MVAGLKEIRIVLFIIISKRVNLASWCIEISAFFVRDLGSWSETVLPSTISETNEHQIWILQPHNVSAEARGLTLGYVGRNLGADILPQSNIQRLQDVTDAFMLKPVQSLAFPAIKYILPLRRHVSNLSFCYNSIEQTCTSTANPQAGQWATPAHRPAFPR